MRGFPHSSISKQSACNTGDPDSIPGSGRCPGGGHGNSLQYSCLENLTFLPRSENLLISWLQSPYAVILEAPQIKSATVSTVSPSICHEGMGPDAMIFIFWMLSFKPTFSLSSFTVIKRFFSSSLLSLIRGVSSGYPRLLNFSQWSCFQLVLLPAQHLSWCTLHIR